MFQRCVERLGIEIRRQVFLRAVGFNELLKIGDFFRIVDIAEKLLEEAHLITTQIREAEITIRNNA